MIGKKRNFGLDIARAISILFVLIAHKFILPVELGVLGVQIFFVLSGFLIGQILIRDFAVAGTFSTVLKFWKRRWYRTLPLYYLILVLKILVYGNPYGWKMIVYFFFLQANFVGIDFFGVSWSLVVEEWFYVFLPLATFIFLKKGIEPRKLLLFLISFIILFFVCRFLWNYSHRGIIIFQFDCLLLGVLLALVKMHFKATYTKLNSPVLFWVGIVGMIYLTKLLGRMENVPLYDTFYRVVWYFLVSICITVIIPFIEQSDFLNIRIRKIKLLYLFFTWTSILTYAIYLLHMEIFQLDFNIPVILNGVIQMLLLYLASYVVYVVYEHPFMNLRDEFSFKRYYSSIRLNPNGN